MNILLIEDELLISKTIVFFIEKLGHQIESTSNGIDALKLLNLNNYDKIITDLMLTDISGFDIIEECISKNIDVKSKIVIITAYNSHDIIERIKRYKCKYFLKPFDNLIETVEDILK